MIMADVLKIVFLIVRILLVFISYWLAGEALFPRFVERAQSEYESHPFKITLLGLATALPLVGISLALGKLAHPAPKMISVVIAAVPLLLGMIGSTGLS